MRRLLVAFLIAVTIPLANPGVAQVDPGTTTPPTPAPAPSAPQVAANPQAVADFAAQVDADLLNHGIGAFKGTDTMFPSLGNVPVYRPFRTSVGGPFGHVYGLVDLFLGYNGSSGLNNVKPELLVLTDLNVGDHLRGHFQGAHLHRLLTSTATRTQSLQEIYAEAYGDGPIKASMGPLTGGTYHGSLRIGKVSQVQFPFIDQLTMADRLPGEFQHYTGALLMGEADTANGAGAHMTLYAHFGGGAPGQNGFVNDAYALYRHAIAQKKLFYEGRLGWVPTMAGGVPASGQFGVQGFVGYQTPSYGAGVFAGTARGNGSTIGINFTLARNAITELFGIAPTATRDKASNFQLALPLVQAYLFSATRPMPDEPIIGQEDEIRTWNNGTFTGLGSTDDLSVAKWGTRPGKDVRRLVNVTPWWYYNLSIQRVSAAAGRRTGNGNELNAHQRSDVQYTYFQVLPRIGYRLSIRAVDAETQKPLKHAMIAITNANGKTETIFTNAKGIATMEMRLAPDVPPTGHLSATAPSHAPATQDVTMAPKALTRLTLLFQPLLGTITGTVIDTVTGQPVSDAEVILSPTSGNPVVHTTGADGTYQFTDIRPGDFTIRLHKPGYADVDQTITVKGGETNKLDFKTAAEKGAVVGRVVDANGAAVGGATITFLDATGATVSTRTSGADGTFLERLNPGTYTINVSATGFAAGTATATIPAGQNVSVTVTLQKQP